MVDNQGTQQKCMNFTGLVSQIGGEEVGWDSWLKYSAKHGDNSKCHLLRISRVPGTILRTLCALTHLILTTTLQSRYCYLHFTGEESEAPNPKQFAKATYLMN